ncbi:hypothetical protein QZH41_006906 [Actinostola sp. cb2023]|nr:hypothetical protein QZH41_006906 [Actinostola sp. cb2023]
MAERSEKTALQDSSVLSTKDESTKPQIDQTNDVEDYSLQDVVEVEYQPDCPVCLQPAFYPVKLPCGHIFCFLCIKGVALRGRKCAICRQVIATEFLEKPTLVKVAEKGHQSKSGLKENVAQDEAEYLWYYEGRNGWWQYDDKTSKEVESCFKSGKRSCTLLIAGFLYLIDFENMFQMRRNEPGRRRRIKRDKCDVDSKGVAGIRKPQSTQNPEVANSNTDTDNQTVNPTINSRQVHCEGPRAETDGAPVTDVVQGGASSSSSSDAASANATVDTVTDDLESTSLNE